MTFVYFLILVGVLVTVHEFGHFFAAKLLGVAVTRFSIGFGPRLVAFRIGETEYRLAWFPLGGYVSLLGEENSDLTEDDDKNRAFSSQSLTRQLLIVFAGPVANLVLTFVLYLWVFSATERLPSAVIGDVLPGGPADQAGLMSGDKILSIDGEATPYFRDVNRLVRSSSADDIRVEVERNGDKKELFVRLHQESYHMRDGSHDRRGYLGIVREPILPIVGVLDRESPAGKAGLQTGDQLVSVGNTMVNSWQDAERELLRVRRAVEVVYVRGDYDPVANVRLVRPHLVVVEPHRGDTLVAKFGIRRSDLFVVAVTRGSPASDCGIRVGDMIASVEGEPMASWRQFEQRLVSEPDKEWRIGIERWSGGSTQSLVLSCRQQWQTRRDALGKPYQRLVWGANNSVVRGDTEWSPVENRVSYAFGSAANETILTTSAMLSGLGSLVVGGEATEEIGGPLMVYYAAAVTREVGGESFVRLMALISINLALLNLLPIPVLDGGQATILIIERVIGRELNSLAKRRIRFAGLVVISLITILALRNDLLRFVF